MLNNKEIKVINRKIKSEYLNQSNNNQKNKEYILFLGNYYDEVCDMLHIDRNISKK